MSDIEVGRHALRTFKTFDGTLQSLYRKHTWTDGKAIAKCLRESNGLRLQLWGGEEVNVPPPCESSPNEECLCGLYGTLTLEQLIREYGASTITGGVAVIAAEGPTIIGSKGLRTSAARIVAYWLGVQGDHGVYARHAPEAKRYTDMTEMLADYNLQPYDGPWPLPSEELRRSEYFRMASGGGGLSVSMPAFSGLPGCPCPMCDPHQQVPQPYVPPSIFSTDFSSKASQGLFQQMDSPQQLIAQQLGTDDDVVDTMDKAGTEGGKSAVRNLLGKIWK